MRKLFMTLGVAIAMSSTFGDVLPGQLERKASDQTALLSGVSIIQAGYIYGGNATIYCVRSPCGVDSIRHLPHASGSVSPWICKTKRNSPLGGSGRNCHP